MYMPNNTVFEPDESWFSGREVIPGYRQEWPGEARGGDEPPPAAAARPPAGTISKSRQPRAKRLVAVGDLAATDQGFSRSGGRGHALGRQRLGVRFQQARPGAGTAHTSKVASASP